MSPAASLYRPPSPTSPTRNEHGRDGQSIAADLLSPSSVLSRPAVSTSIMDELLLASRPLPPLPLSTQGPPMIDLPEVLCLDDLMAIASGHDGGNNGDDDKPHSPATRTSPSLASSVTLGADLDISYPTVSDVPTADERDSSSNRGHVEALAYALHELACGEADFAHLLVALAEVGVPEFLSAPIPTSAQLPDDPMAGSIDSQVYVRHLPDLAALHLTLSGSLSDHDVAQFLPANDGNGTRANAPPLLPTGSVEHAAQAMALAFLDALSSPNAVSLYTSACAPLSHALAQWRLRVPNAPALVSAYQAATAAPCNVCGKPANVAAAAAETSESRHVAHIPDLDSLLASVMQRITRYPLVWSSIRKSLAYVVGSETAAHAPVPVLMAVEMAEARAREVAQAVDEAKLEHDRRVKAFAFWMNAVPKPMAPALTPKGAPIKRCCSTTETPLAQSDGAPGDAHGCAASNTVSSPTTPTSSSFAVLETGALDATVADHADGLLEVSMLMSASARVSVRSWWQGDHFAAGASATSRCNSGGPNSRASIAESVEEGPLSLVLASGLSMEALVVGPPPNPPESTSASLASPLPEIPMDSVGRTLTLSRRSTRGVNRRQSSYSTQSMVISPTGGTNAPVSEHGSMRRPQSTPPTSQLPTPPSSSSSADTYVDVHPALPPLPAAIPPEASSCYWSTINSSRSLSIADSGIVSPVLPPLPPEPQYLGFFLFSDGTLVAASPASPTSNGKQSSSSSSLSLKRQSSIAPSLSADEPTSADSHSPKYHIRYVWRLREDGWAVQELLGSDGVDRFGLRLTGPLATVDFYARSPRVRTSWLAALYSVLCPGQIATPFPSWASVPSTVTPTATPLSSPKITPSASFSTMPKLQQQHPGSPSIGALSCMSLPPLDLPPLADDAMVLPTFVEVPLALPGMPMPPLSTLGRPSTAGSIHSDDSGIAHMTSVRKSKRTSRVWQGLTRAVSRRTKSTSSPNRNATVAADLDRTFAGLFTYIPAATGSFSQTWHSTSIARSSSAVDVAKHHTSPRPLSRAAKSTVDVPSQAARHRERRASSAMDLQTLAAAVMTPASGPAISVVHSTHAGQVSSDALSIMALISPARHVTSPKQVCARVGGMTESEDEDDDDVLFVCPPSRTATPTIGTAPSRPTVEPRPPSPLAVPLRLESLQRSSTMGRRHSSMVRSKSSPTPPPAGLSRSCVSVIISKPLPRSTSLLSKHPESLLGPPSNSDIGEPLPLGPTPSLPTTGDPADSSRFFHTPAASPLTTATSSNALASSLGFCGDGTTHHYSSAMYSLTVGSRRERSASMSPVAGRHVVSSAMDDLGFEPVAIRTTAEREDGEERQGSVGAGARHHKWGKEWLAKWSRRVSGIGSLSIGGSSKKS